MLARAVNTDGDVADGLVRLNNRERRDGLSHNVDRVRRLCKPAVMIGAAAVSRPGRAGAGWTCAIDASSDAGDGCVRLRHGGSAAVRAPGGSGRFCGPFEPGGARHRGSLRTAIQFPPVPTSRRAERGGSRWNSATAKKQTIKTLKTMLGPTWRFMGVRAMVPDLKMRNAMP